MTGKTVWLGVFVLTVATMGGCRKDPKVESRQFAALGDRAMSARKYADAVVAYRAAVSRDPSFGEARLKLGNAYMLSNDPRSAMRELVRAADLLPSNADAQVEAGKLLLVAHQFPEAKARALSALTLQPRNVDALVLLGNALAGLKDLDGAITQVEQAIDADPRQAMIYSNLGAFQQAKGDAAAAEAAFKRSVEVDPRSPAAHLALANYYWSAGRVGDAENELKSGLDLDPKSATANRALAVLYMTTGRQREGEEYLKAYAELAQDVTAKLVLADYYLDVQRIPEALQVLDAVVRSPGGFIPASLRLAAVDFTSNRREKAYQRVEDILKREPRNELALLEKTRFLLSDNRRKDALAPAKLVTTANPLSAAGHYVNGTALRASGDLDDAVKEFQQVLQLKPSAVAAQIALAEAQLARGNADAAIDLAGQAIKNRPRSGLAHLLMARALLASGKVDRAAVEAAAVAQNNTKSVEVQTLLGDVYLAKGDQRRARESYERALQVRADALDPLAGLIRIDLAQNKPDSARTRVESRLAEAPNDPNLLLLAGTTLGAAGDAKRAETMFRHALDVDPSNIEAYDQLGSLYLSQGRLDEAKRDYEDAAKREPKSPSGVAATTMVGIILGMQGKRDEARTQYEQALKVDPQAAVAANNLAWNYAETGRSLDMALQYAQVAKARLPGSWQVSDTLGWIYYKKGLADLSVTSLREAAQQAPANAGIQYHLGLACLKSGDKSAAREALLRALKLDPTFESSDDARRVLATIKS